MKRMHDPSVMILPHPIRADAAMGGAYDTILFDMLGITRELQPYLNDDGISTEWLINNLPAVNALALAHIGVPASVNMGTFVLMMTRARLRAHGDPILTVTPTLQAQLFETDLVSGLPSRFFRCLYPLAFIAFTRPNELRVPNRVSGLHEFEGAYVGTYLLPPHHEMHDKDSRDKGLCLDPSKPTRLIELTLIGSPVGKNNALDDASQDLVLFIQDEDECLSTLLERHLDYYQRPEAYNTPGMRPANPEEVMMVKPIVLQLAKVLLYLNLAEAEQTRLNHRDDLERKFRKYGKLTEPRKALLEAAYNHILIGPSGKPRSESQGQGVGEPSNRIRPHWKRGHFKRIRFGERMSESRLGWIQPYLVNKEEAFGVVNKKEYVVR